MALIKRNSLQVALDMSHAPICLATLRKAEDSSTFLPVYRAIFVAVHVAKNGVTRAIFLATGNTTFIALQVANKTTLCNMGLKLASVLICVVIEKKRYRHFPSYCNAFEEPPANPH